jgi:2-phospho-L-lactate guanylyltransferase (CobY/MobA/RfbA family)
MGPHLFECPADGGYNAIDMALRHEVRSVDALDHAVIAAAGVQTLSTEIDAALANAGSPSPTVSAEADMTYFGTTDVAKLFRKSQNWVRWALRNNVFVRKDGTPIEPVRLGTSSRRRFTVALLHDMAKAAYRRGVLDEVELEGVLRELAAVER